MSDLRLVLLGNIGCGKTSTADTILGQVSPFSPSAPRSCRLRRGFSEGRTLTLAEAPRWYWNGDRVDERVREETKKALALVTPGPHAVLLLVPISQFTEMETRVPAELVELFGEEVLDHTLVLLTCGDYLMGGTVEEYLQKEHEGLGQVIERCGRRYHVVNNRQRQHRQQVQELLEKVEKMVQRNGVFIFKTPEQRELERQMREGKQGLVENDGPQKEEEEEEERGSAASEILPALERRELASNSDRKSEDEVEESMDQVRVSNGLHSSPALQQTYSKAHAHKQLNRTPRLGADAGGPTLPSIPESTATPDVTPTLHHRTNSLETTTPEASTTSSSRSPASSSSSNSSPTTSTSASFFSTPSPPPPPSSPSLSSSSPELRLVMLGRSGAGKSWAGNAILGSDAFQSKSDGFTAITQTCEKKKALVKGRRVAVVDTPDWFNSERTPEEVRAQIASCMALSSPGPHAFLLCVPVDQPARTELQALGALETVFGPDAVKRHTVVLFTYADRLRESGKAGSNNNNNVEEYIARQRGDLLKLVEKCMDRYHIMERGDRRRERESVVELLEKVEQTVREAGGQFHSCPAFQEAEKRMRERRLERARERQQGRVSDLQSKDATAEDEMEETRDEAEMSVEAPRLESLPAIRRYTMSPSLLHSAMEKVESGATLLPKLLAEGSVWVGDGASKVRNSQVWGTVGAAAGRVSKAVGDRVPQVVVDGSAWVGSGAEALASSPVWGKVGTGARTGARLLADGSVRVGAGIGAGAKRVAGSSVWEKVGKAARRVPKVVVAAALLGLVLGAALGGVVGGAVGATAGSAGAEVGRRKFSRKSSSEQTPEAARTAERSMNGNVDAAIKDGEKSLKTE